MNKKNSIYEIKDLDLTIITLDDIFERVQIQVLNSIYPIFTNNYISFSADVKRFFLHYLIKETCDYFKNSKLKNKILVVDPSFSKRKYEIWNYLDKTIVTKFIIQCFKVMHNRFPFPTYQTENIINLEDINSGELKDILYKLVQIKNNYANKCITCKDLLKFTKKKGLIYLTNTYIRSNEFKKLLYCT